MIGQATKKAIIEVQLDDKASGGLKKLQTNTDSVSSGMKAAFNKITIRRSKRSNFSDKPKSRR